MQVNIKPGYLNLLENGRLHEKVKEAKRHLTKCNLYPYKCNVNRKDQLGFCHATDGVIVSSYSPHFGEEAPLVGKNGSCTIFFRYSAQNG
ncbi:Radical SAM domain-containing protein [Tepidanaerobacter acetatoxydans Re1]|uniref:Radical SAM domain-containing protein n=1 Tax=Tepidanaerobacter acetatoxydans (strain DSM 21804 / JCM 16047 / Re1) TaxID=1209989 RepID=F4LR82_TEPAE|nr:hypothetical protein [Tepidanaerobacter acetatoxydans]AEE91096.1 radical SAM domain-containing protein [Tepidanaerobacter acetatoxydans Re1]CCP25738.1 Radical SAM domain-containing protein [Tepidanaerobacter acetatoxydans Re1]